MARQNQKPAPFERTTRVDNVARQTTGRAGVVGLIDYFPVLRGDAVGGQLAYDVTLNHMPKPLRNSVMANVQAWFVPHSALPRFQSYSEFMHAYQQENIEYANPTTGAHVTRTPAPLFTRIAEISAQANAIRASEHYDMLGLQLPTGSVGAYINDMIFDAYSMVWNFRAQAHSNRIPLRDTFMANTALATVFARAFWPQNRFSRVVPDYEQALVMGELSLDVIAGQLPIMNMWRLNLGTNPNYVNETANDRLTTSATDMRIGYHNGTDTADQLRITANRASPVGVATNTLTGAYAELAGNTFNVTLADIDKARQTQAFAKYRTSLHGNNPTGYINDDAIMAELMQGFEVPWDEYDRPILIGSQMSRFQMMERPATDGPSLDLSTSRGRVQGRIPVNVPQNDIGGVVIVTLEVLPERIYERQYDPYLGVTDAFGLPDALRDIRRTEPVDIVQNKRLDVAHTTPNGIYGYEPMNDKWNREFTFLGGEFHQSVPSSDWTETRSALWIPEISNPTYTVDHFLAPANFPHDVFSDETKPAFEVTVARTCVIRGLTQFGDPLVEDNDDFAAVAT